MAAKREAIRGVLHLWSETGTEGGHWSLQDERYITRNTTRFACKACGAYWDKSDGSVGPYVDTLPEDERTKLGSYCPKGTHAMELVCPEDWSYEGLNVLEDGDALTVFDKADPSKVVWKGKVSLRQFNLFSEHSRGLWIHAEQKGIDRDQWAEWFFKGYPAELVKKPKKKKKR